jgi:serine/threonine protein kinase
VSSVLFLIDKTLGKYKVLEHIGHGGMAEVYKGQHVQLDRMVAVKVLHPFLADEEGFVVRFKREARIVATLRHPNIVQVYDFDYNDELSIYYMVMEFIDGPTLKSRLAEDNLSVEEASRIGASIADALDYAHERGMVHRDIKPANIMFISDAEPVLTDFGIAKMLTLSGLTASGAMVGTPAYMAPEVGMGKAGTSSSDIYSLGVVLYQMVTHQLPFESESPMGMVMQHINDQPPSPSNLKADVPPALEAVILRAMEKQPEDRYPNAGEMANALRQAMGIVDTPRRAAPAVQPKTTPPPGASEMPEDYVDDTPVFAYDDDDRLLKTWPLPASEAAKEKERERARQATPTPVAPPASARPSPTPAPSPQPAADVAEPEAAPTRRRRPFVVRVLRALLVLLVLALGGSVVWVSLGGAVPPTVAEFLASAREMGTGSTPTATPKPPDTPTVTPAPEQTATVAVIPSPSPTATPPPPTLTPLVCNFRYRVESVRIEPGNRVPPGTALIAYISLQNSGNCAWPSAATFTFVSGDPLADTDAIPIAPLEQNESTQILLPLRAPSELGSYESTWDVRMEGEALSAAPIAIEVQVEDLPTPTPTPELAATEEPVQDPLAIEAPVLVTWGEDKIGDTWYGTLNLQATGGTGRYRYYRGEISEDTLLPEGDLSFQTRRCEDLQLEIWVLSGDEILRWEGVIPYPNPEGCR